ncbi:hypothetical protein L1999_13080 [Neobacillus drentensis]|uniref:hypothetical protein n=1 Tax=Neobacillus drentensis TaxID=220684 RepID=UPI001F3074E7|nr:hypothetical protein [Neobacillus drentensis]ULT59399.1 hypothetical protein L1999_13080 [Neobacillus drentensis]
MNQLQTRKSQKSEGVSEVEPTSDKAKPQSAMMSEEIPNNAETHEFNRGRFIKKNYLGETKTYVIMKEQCFLKTAKTY